MKQFKTIKDRGREARVAGIQSKHAAMRAKKAHGKMLKARSEAQAFNQSIWSTVAYRHGTNQVNDPTVKTMLGQGKSETE